MGNEKYVFIDIDGTIYDYDFGLSPLTKIAIKKLKENGHHPIICTGRTRVMIFDEIINMGFDGIVAGGGSFVEWRGKLLLLKELPIPELKRIITCLKENHFAAYPEGNEYFYYDPDYVKEGTNMIYSIYQREIPDYIRPINYTDMKASKVSASFTEESTPEPVFKELSKDYICVRHDNKLLETIPRDSSKAYGVRFLMDYLNADLRDSVGIGDSFNDLDMLKTVGLGIAMGNSPDELKAQIPTHTETLKEDGFYHALERLGLI